MSQELLECEHLIGQGWKDTAYRDWAAQPRGLASVFPPHTYNCLTGE